MAAWLWYFVWYSLFGYLLEKAFAAFTGARRQTRKCLVVLPLCPVYGVAMLLMLWLLPRAETMPLLVLVCCAGLLATVAEYGVDLLYHRVLGVRFWSYAHQPLNLNGRVCLLFSLIWGILGGAALRLIQPPLESFVAGISPALSYGLLLLLTADGLCSAQLLRRWGDTELLSWGNLRRQLR